MPFVIDASTVLSWAFVDEKDPIADAAAERAVRDRPLAPALWWFELRNGLIVNERRQRITAPATHAFLGRVRRIGIVLDREPDEAAVLHLARLHRLTVYDAIYLELALRRQVGLVTLDTALAKAARTAGVSQV